MILVQRAAYLPAFRGDAGVRASANRPISNRSAQTTIGAAASVIKQANAILLAIAPGFNRAQRQSALSVMNLESGFGVSGSWLLENGKPSYNAGALTCNAGRKGTAGCFSHGDVTATGAPTTYQFMAFHSMREGIQAFLNTWGRDDTLGAAGRGDAHAIAAAMYGHHYYTGSKGSDEDRINLYAKAILGSAKEVAGVLGEPLSVSAGSSSLAAGVGSVPAWGWALVLVVTGGIFYAVLA